MRGQPGSWSKKNLLKMFEEAQGQRSMDAHVRQTQEEVQSDAIIYLNDRLDHEFLQTVGAVPPGLLERKNEEAKREKADRQRIAARRCPSALERVGIRRLSSNTDINKLKEPTKECFSCEEKRIGNAVLAGVERGCIGELKRAMEQFEHRGGDGSGLGQSDDRLKWQDNEQ